MADRLLKKKAHKVTPKKSQVKETTDAVIVGSYKERQLAWIKRHGIYNYPVREEEECEFEVVKELWLYADVKGTRHIFEAEFVGKMLRKEFLAANPTYAKLGPSKNKAYYVFKTNFLEYGSRLDNPIVIARTADFGGRSAKLKKAIEQFEADGEFAPLTAYLPSDLAKIPATQLRIGEAAVQLDFFNDIVIDPKKDVNPIVKDSSGLVAMYKYKQMDALSFMRDMPSETVQLVLTSPPYNVGKEYEAKTSIQQYLATMKPVVNQIARILKPGGSVCWQVGNYVENGEVFPLDIFYYGLFKDVGLRS